MHSFGMRCFVLIASAVWLFLASQSDSPLLHALARKAGCQEQKVSSWDQIGGTELSDAEAARCLFKAWYPKSRLKHGYDPSNTDESETYGELELEGVEQILSKVTEFGAPLSVDDVFADLGSGIGQVALMVFLKTYTRRAVGIELVPQRHDKALAAYEQMQQALEELEGDENYRGTFPAGSRELRFLQGDIRDQMLWEHWADASVVFTCSILFLDDLIDGLREAFIANLKPGALVFSLKNLWGNHKDLAPLITFQAKTSWERSAKVFLYIRNLEPLVLNELNLAIGESTSVLDDCTEWGFNGEKFTASNLCKRFCTCFALKWDERARNGQPRIDYDWVTPEL